MELRLKTGLDRLALETLIERRNSLLNQRKALLLRLKATQGNRPLAKLVKRRLLKNLKVLNFRIRRVTNAIKKRPQNVRQGGKIVRTIPNSIIPLANQFKPSDASSFKPSVALPVIPVPLPESVMPKGYEYEEKMPSFVAEEPELELMEEEIIVEEPTGFDLMTFVDDNKFLIGGAVFVGLFLAFKPKAKKRSNPKRKSRKRKAVRRVRRNKRRSGYHRQ